LNNFWNRATAANVSTSVITATCSSDWSNYRDWTGIALIRATIITTAAVLFFFLYSFSLLRFSFRFFILTIFIILRPVG
jgi:ABC-type maltose transport system permease subunit